MEDVAISTVAASVLATINTNGPMTQAEVRARMQLLGFEASEAQVYNATRALVSRELLRIGETDKLVSCLPPNWVMAQRARAEEDATGWDGWVMKNMVTGALKPLAELDRVPQ